MAVSSKNKGGISAFFDILIKYWYVILGLIVAIPLLFRFVKKQAEVNKVQEIKLTQDYNSAENEAQIPDVIKDKAEQIFKKHKVTASKAKATFKKEAQDLAHNLGASYSWFNPQSWTENDKEVGDALIRMTYYYPIIEDLYYGVYTKSKNLSSDVLRKLDNDQIKRVRLYWKTKGKNWL